MTTICVLIEDTIANYKTINKIIEIFPCYYNYKRVFGCLLEITIRCREEDAKAIEDILADVV